MLVPLRHGAENSGHILEIRRELKEEERVRVKKKRRNPKSSLYMYVVLCTLQRSMSKACLYT